MFVYVLSKQIGPAPVLQSIFANYWTATRSLDKEGVNPEPTHWFPRDTQPLRWYFEDGYQIEKILVQN